MKKFLIIIILFGTVAYAQNKTYTLKESLQTGLQNSKNVKISQSMLKSAQERVTEVGSQMYPQLSLSAPAFAIPRYR